MTSGIVVGHGFQAEASSMSLEQCSMVKLFRVGFTFFVALVCVISPVSFSLVSPAWAVTEWTQVGSDIDGEAAKDESGRSVALSSDGTRVAIGAPGSGDDSGQVRVYDLTGGAWVQVGGDIDGEAAGDASGAAVSLSADGTRVAIGAPVNAGNGSEAGHVRIYQLDGNAWVKMGSDIDGEAAGDLSGEAVSLSSDGSRVAIGGRWNDGNGNDAGHVRVYDWTGSAWVKMGSDIDGEAADDNSGKAVSLSSDGTRVAIGAPQNNGAGLAAGHVRVYQLDGNAWVKVGSDIDGEAADDYSGGSVSLSADGTRVAIGANYNSDSAFYAGHVRVYDLDGGAWVQVGSDIDGEAAEDQSGGSVALSSDGSRVAIGAEFNAGTGFEEAGHVRVFTLTADNWTQIGSDFDGEAEYGIFGISVSLNSDGSRVAIGAPEIGAGHVQVHSYPVPEDENETPSEELAETGVADASGIAFGGAIALVVGAGGYLLRRRGARA